MRSVILHMKGGIFVRIAAMFLVVLALPIGIILTFMNSAFQRNDFQETLRTQRYSMAQVQTGLNRFLDLLDQQIMDIIYSGDVQRSLISSANISGVNAIISSKAFKEAVYIVYVDNKDEAYSSDNVYYPKRSLSEVLKGSAIYQSFQNSYAGLSWCLDESNLFNINFVNRDQYALFAGRYVRHLDINVKPGFIIVQIMPAQIATLIYDPLMREGTRYLLLDTEGRIVLDDAGELSIGTALNTTGLMEKVRLGEESYYGELELGKQLYLFGSVGNTGLTLVSCLSEDRVRETRNELNQLLYTIALISSGAALLLALIFSFGYSKPIKEMVHAMRRVRKGDFDVQVNIDRSDEIGELSQTFNVMTKDMLSLIDQTKRDQNELKHAEINALIYQINPHFLYNTLDNINMLARRSDEKRISMLITELSSLLRVTLSGGRDMIPLKSEMQHARNYLRIMQLRSGALFEYDVTCEPSIEEILIMKFILQPLAENAIQHGLNYVNEGGFVRVSARCAGEMIRLSVEDNGIGMEREQMEALKEGLAMSAEAGERTERGVGLLNVYKRLSIRYSEENFSMEFIRSDLGGLGVLIQIRTKSVNY